MFPITIEYPSMFSGTCSQYRLAQSSSMPQPFAVRTRKLVHNSAIDADKIILRPLAKQSDFSQTELAPQRPSGRRRRDFYRRRRRKPRTVRKCGIYSISQPGTCIPSFKISSITPSWYEPQLFLSSRQALIAHRIRPSRLNRLPRGNGGCAV